MAPSESPQPVKVFVSYAHEDEPYRRELLRTLADWQRESLIHLWTDHELVPGDQWDQQIRNELESAELILFLVSRSSIASDYIDAVEFARALERHRLGNARVVPIIVSRCDWSKLAWLQAIPRSGMPISKYADAEDAWYEVRMELKAVIEGMRASRPAPAKPEERRSQAPQAPPEAILKLCDRTRQESAFVEFYEDLLEARPGAAQLYVIVEDDLDRPEFLVDRLYEMRVAPLAIRRDGKVRGSCLRAVGGELVYGSWRNLQRSSIRNFFAGFDAPLSQPPLARAMLADEGLSLHSHILVEQTVDGEKAGADAGKLAAWWMNEFWAAATSAKTQWLGFLIFRFSSLDPSNSGLHDQLYNNLKGLFDEAGRANTAADSAGAPCILLPPPDPLRPEDLLAVLKRFPVSSVQTLNETTLRLFRELAPQPRMDQVFERLRKLRQDFERTGNFQV